jgi:hypothetical protein
MVPLHDHQEAVRRRQSEENARRPERERADRREELAEVDRGIDDEREERQPEELKQGSQIGFSTEMSGRLGATPRTMSRGVS